MAKRPARYVSSRRRNRSGLRPSSEHWLLLLGAVVAFAAIFGSLTDLPWPTETTTDHRKPRLTMAQARASNALVPIVADKRKRAEPFRFRGGPAARLQATECLATVALYEVGADRDGQRAVIQVVLNRVGARGFPKTVCGVVYQGANRKTGCQFSFTCDGSQTRRPEHDGWEQARRAARRAMNGYVYTPVGRATHYHTDWLVPYWRSSLVKVATVGSHIFYQRR
ncbi:cell wall hydrolase [Sphingomonas sp. PP-CE-3G-477]|uniref:cell wall hydrolase n=1 Tax=Sphingomonas sp. PP-CE-3G-477 TaxID=2135660 RepID=UPI000D384FA0|nr:cell wall hydrolase [Sphingomonas sp. PP-CE-3G-477]PTQ65695.1 cell wall hydrolase [Sphingomonas sp. PP-CE-3G-477]